MKLKDLEHTLSEGFRVIPIGKLTRATWNYKIDDANKAKILKASIERNKEALILVVREVKGGLFEVIDGNHRLDVLGELHWPGAICRNLGKISDVDAKRLAISINETKFAYDPAKLGGILNELISSGETVEDLCKIVPFNSVEVQSFMSLAFDDFKVVAEGLDEEAGGDGDMDEIPEAGTPEEAQASDAKNQDNALTFYFGTETYPVVVKALDAVMRDRGVKTRADALYELCRDFIGTLTAPKTSRANPIKHRGVPKTRRGAI